MWSQLNNFQDLLTQLASNRLPAMSAGLYELHLLKIGGDTVLNNFSRIKYNKIDSFSITHRNPIRSGNHWSWPFWFWLLMSEAVLETEAEVAKRWLQQSSQFDIQFWNKYITTFTYRLGNEAFSSKKFDAAISHYTEAIRLDPENAIYYSNRRFGDSVVVLTENGNDCWSV